MFYSWRDRQRTGRARRVGEKRVKGGEWVGMWVGDGNPESFIRIDSSAPAQ